MNLNRLPCNGTCETEMGCDCIKRQPVVGDQQVRYQVREVGQPVVPAAFTPDEFIQDLGDGPRGVTAAALLPWVLLSVAVTLLLMTWALIFTGVPRAG